MASTSKPSEPRVPIALTMKASAKEALARYCAFMDTTKFIEKRALEYERKCLRQLTEEQRKGYFDGSLTFDDLGEEERHASTAPAHKSADGDRAPPVEPSHAP
jgi:hypothetical protein